MSGKRQVDVTIRGRDETKPAFDSAKSNATSFGASVRELLNPMNLLKGALAGVGLATFTNLLRSSVQSASGADEAWGRLSSAVTNLGLSSAQLRPELDAVAAGIQKTTRFADDAVQGALSQLISISGDYAGSLKNITLVTDLAVAKNIDLEAAAKIVGKAMTGETKGLERFGIIVQEGTDAVEAMRTQFAGFAARDGESMRGQLAQVANAWDNVQEAIGRAVLGDGSGSPGLETFADALNKLGEWIDGNSSGLRDLASDLAAAAAGLVTLARKAADLYDTPLFALHRGNVARGRSLLNFLGSFAGGGEEAGPTFSGAPIRLDGAVVTTPATTKATQKDTPGKAKKPKIFGRLKLSDRDRPQEAGRSLFDDILDNRAAETLGIGPFQSANPLAAGDAAIGSAVGEYGKEFAANFEEMQASVDRTIESMRTLGDEITEVATGAITTFASTWADAVGEIVTGSQAVGAAIVGAARRAVGGAAQAKGRETLLDAAKAAAEGFKNPVNFIRAAKLFAVGSGYMALGSLLAGGGGGGGGGGAGGGGGGISGGGFRETQAEVGGQGQVTVLFKGKKSLIDLSDPDDQEQFAAMIRKITGTRQVVYQFGEG